MKVIYWVIAIVFGIPALFLIVIYGASELGGEVVTLERAEQNGETSSVRIWIVDDSDASLIEHGDTDSYWISQLAESPRIVLSRDGQSTSFMAVADRNSHDLYHKLRREKYGWADEVLALFSGSAEECQGTPVRLQSAN